MIGLDTNVLVRYIVQDDQDQSPRATRLIESLDEHNQGFVSVVALVELHWVLRRAYKVSRDDAAVIIRKLLDAQELSLQEPDTIRRALRRLTDDVDFSDALIRELDAAAGCAYTATFDRRATRLAGIELVPWVDSTQSE
ncbi:MAG: PIN domain-containing protein [Egibacteraceae bacterium]